MSDERRLDRLEDKVDKVNDKVEAVDKRTIKMEAKLDQHIDVIERHVTGDNKIIDHIQPLIPHLESIAEMAQDHVYKKKLKEERMDKLFVVGNKVKIWGGVVGIASAILAFLSKYTNLFR